MLQFETVEPRTLSLLKELQSLDYLADFYLVGGTALSLQLGHRRSIDLDLFCKKQFDKTAVRRRLNERFAERIRARQNAIGVFGFIDEVKIDLVEFQYPLLKQPLLVDGVRMYDLPDIAAMKVNAILRRATKKDFWDIAEIVERMSLDEIVSAYDEKFQDQRLLISIPHALTYFDEADEEVANPISLKGQTWESVKERLRSAVNEYLK